MIRFARNLSGGVGGARAFPGSDAYPGAGDSGVATASDDANREAGRSRIDAGHGMTGGQISDATGSLPDVRSGEAGAAERATVGTARNLTQPQSAATSQDVFDRQVADAQELPERSENRFGGVGASWQPVTVPPPVYTLKPTAPRYAPASPGGSDAENTRDDGAMPRGTADGSDTRATDEVGAAEWGDAACQVQESGGRIVDLTQHGEHPAVIRRSYNWADDLDVALARRRASHG